MKGEFHSRIKDLTRVIDDNFDSKIREEVELNHCSKRPYGECSGCPGIYFISSDRCPVYASEAERILSNNIYD